MSNHIEGQVVTCGVVLTVTCALVSAPGLHYTAATALLDSGTAQAEVAGFMRHADLTTLQRYDDNRKRRGYAAAARLAELVTL